MQWDSDVLKTLTFSNKLRKSKSQWRNFGVEVIKKMSQTITALTPRDARAAFRIYFILGALFICALVVSNLIFQKFFEWNPFGVYNFQISVGLLPYPITFLITDLVSEVYGKKKATQMVTTGIFASLFSLIIVYVADAVPAMEQSAIGNELFTKVFGATALAVFASMSAYLLAQYVDIHIYHFWKRVTKGKHLWLRNNFSTFVSQFIDTFSVTFLLCSFGILDWSLFPKLLEAGVLFKIIVAALDTPLLYIGVWAFKRRFKLAEEEEIDLPV